MSDGDTPEVMMDNAELLAIIAQQNATNEKMAKLLDMVVTGQKNDPSSQSATWPNIYAQGGVFGQGGSAPDLYATIARPINNASSVLASSLRPSMYVNEVMEIVTGYLPHTGQNANGICDPAPKVGRFKVCRKVTPFGCYKMGTEVVAVPTLGQYRDYSIQPRTINNINQPSSPFMPDMVSRMVNPVGDIGLQMWRLGLQIEVDSAVVMADGDPSRAGAGRQAGWISEFRGLSNWVTTGNVDAVTGIPCPAADSAVYNFNNLITSNGAGDGTVGLSISEAVRNLYYSVRMRAEEFGMPGVQFAFVGHDKLFFKLVDVIACEYAFTRCQTTSSRDVVMTGTDIVTMRNAMMDGKYLMIDNIQIPYLRLDEFPENVVSNNVYESDLYIVPISWQGLPLTYMEYFNQNNPEARQAMEFIPPGMMSVINNGLWSMFSNFKEGCLELSIYGCMRLIMRMTALAGRLDNLRYEYLVQSRDSQIGRSLYRDGGVSIRT